MSKPNFIYSMVAMKCPRCRQGKQFRTSLIAMKGIYDMHEECPKCKLHFENEPGFWWGAMYIGYALSSGALLITALICLVVLGMSLTNTYITIALVTLIGFIYNARLSRSIWLYINYKYKPDAIAEAEQNT